MAGMSALLSKQRSCAYLRSTTVKAVFNVSSCTVAAHIQHGVRIVCNPALEVRLTLLASFPLQLLQIVPVENIEGRKAAEEGDTCLRRTFSGVDLNRNWGTEWKQQVCPTCMLCREATSPLLDFCNVWPATISCTVSP